MSRIGEKINYVAWLFISISYFITERTTRYIGYIYLSIVGAKFGRGLKLYGLPLVSLYPKSSIELGEQVILRSKSGGNAIGVNHKVIIRTQKENAVVKIGSRVGMSGGAICARERVEIGDDVMIGSNVVIADNDFHSIYHDERRGGPDEKIEAKEVIISNCVWIGADAYICKGVTIGEHSVIGAKSVVTKSIPPRCIAAGIPAKVIRLL